MKYDHSAGGCPKRVRKLRPWSRGILAALAAVSGTAAATAPGPARAELREFYIVSVHYDGKTNVAGDATHKPEAFPDDPFANSGGMWVKRPKDNGDWQARAFVFDPAQVTVHQSDKVKLHFVGVHGGSHHVSLEGVEDAVEVKRGTMKTIAFTARKPGLISYICADHPPSMRGQVVVLASP